MTSSNCSYYTATNSQYENLGFDFFKPSKSSKTPTILQVLPALESGGVERGTLEISEAIMASSWRSLVISKGGRLVEPLERQGAKHFEINIGSKNPFAWPKSFKKLKRVISEYNVDVVHARSRMPAWICKYGAEQCGVPFITTFHGRYRDTNALKRIYNSIMVRGECVIAISKFLANDIQSRYGVSDDALKVIPRGADISLFNREIVSEETTNRLIKNWGVPDNTPVIMLPARLTRWKGHGLLINALSLIKDMPFFCILVGEYDTKTSYKSETVSKYPSYWLKAVKTLSKRDKVLKKLIIKYNDKFLTTRKDIFYSLCKSIVGQQISVSAANSVFKKFQKKTKRVNPLEVSKLSISQLKSCGLSRQKALGIKELSVKFVKKEFDPKLIKNMNDEEAIQYLSSLRQIGRWSAEMILLFTYNRSNIWPLQDIGLLRAISNNYKKKYFPPKSFLNKLYKKFTPYCSVATWYLWRSIDDEPIQY